MVKSIKVRYMPMELEMDAALQLIQLSGDSYNEEESRENTQETSSSSMATAKLIRKRKFRSVVDLYEESQPLINMMMKKNKH
ncbi:hypothetical protein P3S67_022389 [Capsicum chacoense]